MDDINPNSVLNYLQASFKLEKMVMEKFQAHININPDEDFIIKLVPGINCNFDNFSIPESKNDTSNTIHISTRPVNLDIDENNLKKLGYKLITVIKPVKRINGHGKEITLNQVLGYKIKKLPATN